MHAYKKFEDVLGPAVQELGMRSAAITKKEIAEVQACGDNEYCAKMAVWRATQDRHALAREVHGPLASLYNEQMEIVRQAMNDYWQRTCPLIDSICDPLLQDWQDKERQFVVWRFLFSHRVPVPGWASMVFTLMIEPDSPPPPPPPPEEKKEPNTAKAKKGPDFPPPGSFGFGPLSVSWDSNGFTIQGGEGLFGGITQRFKGPSGHAETTLFAGVGISESAGPLTAGAKAVVSFTQAGGQVVDLGMSASSSLGGTTGMGPGGSAETSLSWSARGGPDMSWSAEASWMGTSSKIGF
jgi:hypothetical protein